MKNAIVRHGVAAGAGALLVLGLSAAAFAQSTPAPNSPTPQSSPASTTPGTPSSTTPASQNPQSATSPAATPTSTPGATEQQPQKTLQMVPAQAELNKTIDAKKAKQGDPVTAKLEQDVTIPNSQALPKNTVLEGHVDQVTASDHKSDSTMVVTFDKAKLKDGQELPIKATVIAVSEPAMQQASAGGSMPSGGGAPSSGGGMPSSGGSSGGGMRGGGGSGGGAEPSAPQQPASAPDAGGNQQQAQGNATNGVPDVTLTSNIREHSSATFTSKGRNVHVPGGTQMQVAVAIIPAGVRLP